MWQSGNLDKYWPIFTGPGLPQGPEAAEDNGDKALGETPLASEHTEPSHLASQAEELDTAEQPPSAFNKAEEKLQEEAREREYALAPVTTGVHCNFLPSAKLALQIFPNSHLIF